MIERLRSEYDGDFPNKLHQNNLYQTENQSQEIRCSVCGKWCFVDDDTFKGIEMRIKHDFDNQFVCDECEFQDEEFV